MTGNRELCFSYQGFRGKCNIIFKMSLNGSYSLTGHVGQDLPAVYTGYTCPQHKQIQCYLFHKHLLFGFKRSF